MAKEASADARRYGKAQMSPVGEQTETTLWYCIVEFKFHCTLYHSRKKTAVKLKSVKKKLFVDIFHRQKAKSRIYFNPFNIPSVMRGKKGSAFKVR